MRSYQTRGFESPLRYHLWCCGVIGNTRDSDSLVLGSRPNGTANMASSYNGSIGDFESFGVGPIPALAANKLKDNVVDANIGGVDRPKILVRAEPRRLLLWL